MGSTCTAGRCTPGRTTVISPIDRPTVPPTLRPTVIIWQEGIAVGGTPRWPYGSTARVRSLVLLALGVVRVATASQLRQLVLPGTADAQTVRNACKDLKGAGLVESVGSTSRPGKSG